LPVLDDLVKGLRGEDEVKRVELGKGEIGAGKSKLKSDNRLFITMDASILFGK